MIVFFILLMSVRWEINDFLGNNLTQIIENGARILAFLYSAYLYMANKKGKISPVFLTLTLMQVWLLISTVINHGNFWNCLVLSCCFDRFIIRGYGE